MSGDGKQSDDVTIPFVFLFSVEASQLLQAIVSAHGSLIVTIGNHNNDTNFFLIVIQKNKK